MLVHSTISLCPQLIPFEGAAKRWTDSSWIAIYFDVGDRGVFEARNIYQRVHGAHSTSDSPIQWQTNSEYLRSNSQSLNYLHRSSAQ